MYLQINYIFPIILQNSYYIIVLLRNQFVKNPAVHGYNIWNKQILPQKDKKVTIEAKRES